jgi:hypothetical protein
MPAGERVINIAQIRGDKCDMNILIETLREAPSLAGFRASLLPGLAAASAINPSLREPLADRL